MEQSNYNVPEHLKLGSTIYVESYGKTSRGVIIGMTKLTIDIRWASGNINRYRWDSEFLLTMVIQCTTE